MNQPPTTAFDRVVPRRIWLKGPGRSVVIWSVISVLCLCSLLVSLALLSDLLATQGHVAVGFSEARYLRDQLGEAAPAEVSGQQDDGTVVLMRGRGLLPAVVRSQGRPIWSPLLNWAYRTLPWLQESGSALLCLILVSASLGLFLTIAVARARSMNFRVAMQVAAHHRTAIHRQALRLGAGDLTGDSRQAALQLFHSETDRVRDGVLAWGQSLVRDPLLFVLLLLIAFSVDPQLTFQCLVPLAACWWLFHYQLSLGQQGRRLAEGQAESELRLLAESMNKTRIVRGYNMETFEQEQFKKHLERFTRDVSTGRRYENVSIWVSRVLTVICFSLVMYMVGTRMLRLTSPLPVYAAALLVLTFVCLVPVTESLLALRSMRQTISTSADKIFRYLSRTPEVGQAIGAKFLDPVSKSIIFESVNYRVDTQPILRDFDVRIAAGTSTAIVSTDPMQTRAVAYLLPRFIEPQSGRILFDIEDINWATLESIRAETIYVGGEDPFFTGTVMENITCGQSEYSLQDATDAAKMVHAHKFITSLPNGYETMIGEHGESLTAGQGFLLGLARAALRNPAVMIIVEPLARLDENTKTLLDDAYNRLLPNRTVIFLPSRLSTVRRCGQVVFIHEGRAEAVGTHAELLKKSEHYRHWEYVTFNAFRHKGDDTGRAAS